MPNVEGQFLTKADIQCNVPGKTVEFQSYTTPQGIEVFPCDYLSKADNVTCEITDQRCLYRREWPSTSEAIDPAIVTMDTVYGKLKYNPETRELIKSPLWENPSDESIKLPRIQGIYLENFMRNPGKVFSAADLYRISHPDDNSIPTDLCSVRVNLGNLRKNLGKEPEATKDTDRLIATVVNKGYVMRKPNKSVPHAL